MRAPRFTVTVVIVSAAMIVGACLPAAIRPTPTPSPRPTPVPTVAPPTATPAPPTPTPGPTFELHKVVRGDSLISLARKYHTTARSIAYWNRAKYPSLDPESAKYNPNGLKRGWVLQIMAGQEYVPPIDDGETGEMVTPSPDDSEDYETASPDASPDASPGG